MRLVELARETVPEYATGAMTYELAQLFKATHTQLVERRFLSDAKGMAVPDAGQHLIVLDTGCLKGDRIFTIRHEFAHILAGEVEDAMYLTSEDTMSFSERRADLFALADVTPTWLMTWRKRKVRTWKALTLEVVQSYRELTEGWSEQRLWDRAKLRVLLFREHGI